MKKIRYMMLSLMAAMLMAMPMQAQNVTNDEVVETQDDTEVADSTMLDSLAADTLRLPWPESVKVGIDNLLKSKMFETSQVGIMYAWMLPTRIRRRPSVTSLTSTPSV
jgi:serine-type D-Ala-D-Ala carboxypeptidase/endopeptidase (penicillin-binding protein 4)